MQTSTWSPEQYHLFRREREQAFFDLLAMVEPAPSMRIVDLGCGTGELTEHLHRTLCAAQTVGVDSAVSMLDRARARTGGGLLFERDDIASLHKGPFDLVFSNAALHWVADHPSLFARLIACVRPGGQLAVQVPYNFDQPSHTAADAVAGEEPFRSALRGYVKPVHVLRPEQYAALLHTLGMQRITVRMQVYLHLLACRDAVVEWVKGTTLTAYRERLPEALYEPFLERYRVRLFEQLADERPLPFTFNRIFLWARKPSGDEAPAT